MQNHGVPVGRIATAWLAACLLAPTAAAAPKDFPKKARLGVVRKPTPRTFLYALPKGVTARADPPVVRAKLGDKKVVFADVDGNGSFGDVGVDGWMVDSPSYRFLAPLEDSIMLDEWRVWLRFGEKGKFVHFRAEYPQLPPVDLGPTKEDRAAAKRVRRSLVVSLVNWNRLRLRSGLAPVHLDPELSHAAMLHALYMDRHGVTHVEQPDKVGYTEEGAQAGRNGSVGPAPISQEIRFCHRSFYHRLMLFHPDTRGIGLGQGRRRATLDGVSGRKPRPWNWPVLIPAPGVHDVPLSMSEEKPIPHPETFKTLARLAEAGFPITVTFQRPDVKDVTAELRNGGPRGAEIAHALSWPKEPANPAQPTNFKSICLIPLHRLAPKTTYWVRVAYTYRRKQGVREWTFTTGAK